jgi:prepilin-type N-terminal cleavage/methylation domain-containing protein
MTGRPRAAGERGERGERGMTVVELMIAVVVLAIVVAAAFSVSFAIMNGYREHRRGTAVERSARGATAVLTDAVRNASPGVPKGQIVDLVGCDYTWRGIRVVNASDAPDSIELVYGKGGPVTAALGVVTTLRAPYTDASATIVVEDATHLKPNDQILITDFVTGHLVRIETVTQAAPDWNITLTGGATPQTVCGAAGPPPPFNYPARSTVMRAQRARFYVDESSSPTLMIDTDGVLPDDPVAEGIEDLQIAIGVNRGGGAGLDETRAAGDDDDWVYNHEDDADLPDLAVTPWRAIRMTVIARSTEDTSRGNVSLRPAAEDRPDGTPDPFRRRSLSAIIEIRNLEGSP